MTSNPLAPLFAQLKACPSTDSRINRKKLFEIWGCFTRIDLEHGDTITPAVLAGVILHDPETFASLLNEQDHAQLVALAQKAQERYEQLANPPNTLGKTIAATLKESP